MLLLVPERGPCDDQTASSEDHSGSSKEDKGFTDLLRSSHFRCLIGMQPLRTRTTVAPGQPAKAGPFPLNRIVA